MKILLVEDDAKAAKLIARGLLEEGFYIDIVSTVAEALAAPLGIYHLILLDWMLPDGDGLDVCIKLRKSKMMIPILMLTARDTVTDKITGLNSGADDYLPKPFVFEELLARMHSLLRRNAYTKVEMITIAGISIQTYTKTVIRHGHRVILTAKEFDLLEMLMRNAGSVISRKEIAQRLWQQDMIGIDNLIDVNIKNLRQKIDLPSQSKLIHTVRGAGFIFEERREIET